LAPDSLSWLSNSNPKLPQTTQPFALRQEGLSPHCHPPCYWLSPSQGGQRYEIFRSVKPPPLSAPHFRRERKGTKFLTFASPLRRHLTISQRPGQPYSWLYPTVILPAITSPLLGACKGTKFFALSSPASIRPTFQQGAQRYEVSDIRKPSSAPSLSDS